MDAFTDAYMAWDLHRTDPVPSATPQGVSGGYPIRIVDVFGKYLPHVVKQANLTIAPPGSWSESLGDLSTDAYIGCTLIHHGAVPSSPTKPSVAITIQTLELYRLAHFRCPQLSISAFVKTLSDMHSVSPHMLDLFDCIPQWAPGLI
jgi:hypothetical protein